MFSCCSFSSGLNKFWSMVVQRELSSQVKLSLYLSVRGVFSGPWFRSPEERIQLDPGCLLGDVFWTGTRP